MGLELIEEPKSIIDDYAFLMEYFESCTKLFDFLKSVSKNHRIMIALL